MNKRHQMMFDYKNGSDVDREHILKIAQEYNIKNASYMIDEMLEVNIAGMSRCFIKQLRCLPKYF